MGEDHVVEDVAEIEFLSNLSLRKQRNEGLWIRRILFRFPFFGTKRFQPGYGRVV